MPTWDEINAQKRIQEERAKLRVSAGTSVQRITSDTLPRSNSLSDHKPSVPLPETVVGDPLALVSNGSPVGSPLESAPKTAKKRSRQLLKIRLEHADNVMNIVENWRLERQAAPKVAKAIQLLAAIEAGNADYIRENYPLLVEALQKGKKRSGTPSLKESDSYTEGSDSKTERESVKCEPAVEQIAEAIQTSTGRDRHLNRDVYGLAAELHQLDYTAQDIDVWYQRCWRTSWPGDKGGAPTFKQLRERIGEVRRLSVDQSGQPEPNPYLADPFFARHTNDPLPPEEEPPVWPPKGCNGGKAVLDPFLATMGQLQIRLNRATYDTWLGHAEAIHFVGDQRRGGVLYVAVPHSYCKDWIDRFLLTNLNKDFDSFANKSSVLQERNRNDPLFRVQIIVEGDPVPGLESEQTHVHHHAVDGATG